MKNLSIDIETYSSRDLAKCGVYKYAESPDFEILLFGYAKDYGDVRVVDLARGEKIPEDVLDALTNPDITKWAFNAQFERVCLSAWMKEHEPKRMRADYLCPAGWKCSSVWSAYMGLPRSLADVGIVLGLSEQKASGGQGADTLFLHTKQERKQKKPSGRCTGEMGIVQSVQQTGCGSRNGHSKAITKFPCAGFCLG